MNRPIVAIRVFILVSSVTILCQSAPAQTNGARSNRISLRGSSADSVSVAPRNATPTLSIPGALPATRLGVSNPGKLPSLSVQVSLSEPSGNNVLDAGEKGSLNVTVTNEGKSPATNLRVRLTAVNPVFGVDLGQASAIEQLTGGASRSVDIPITASEAVRSQSARYRVEVLEERGFDLDPPAIVTFGLREFSPPKLVLADYTAEGANGTNVIKAREIVEFTVRFQNRGESAARNVTVDVRANENNSLEEGTPTKYQLGDLLPGQFKDIKFSSYANNRANSIGMSFMLHESRSRFDTTAVLEMALNKPPKKAMEFIAVATGTAMKSIANAPSLAVDVDVNIPKTATLNQNAFALVIGNSSYQKTKKVDYAIRDATSMRRYLIDVFGFKEENIVFLTDVSKSDFELYFGTRENHRGKLFNMIKPKVSDVFIFYSGHGAPGINDHKGYFVPVECDPNYVELQGYSSETLYANLSKMEAQSFTIVLDACFSGAELVKNVSPLLLKLDEATFPLKNGVVISSSKNDQVSSWYIEKQHGMFTYFFLKGIHDRAADLNNDGVVTVEEMYSYLANRTEGVPYFARRVNGIEQTPTITGEASGKVLVRY